MASIVEEYSKKGKTKDKKLKGINIDLNTLNMLVIYVLSDNPTITLGNFKNLNTLLESIDLTDMMDQNKKPKLDFVKSVCDIRLKSVNEYNIILHMLSGKSTDLANIAKKNHRALSDAEAEYVSNWIDDNVKSMVFVDKAFALKQALNLYISADYQDRINMIEDLEHELSDATTSILDVKTDNSETSFFIVGDNKFKDNLKQIYSEVTTPGNMLRCGMKSLNEVLGGGFEKHRVYTILGLQGEGKSLTLLNLAIQLRKWNKDYQLRDPSKKPAVVYWSLENSKKESVDRMFSVVCGSDKPLRSFKNFDDVIEVVNNTPEMQVSEEYPITLILKYDLPNSKDTSYLYQMTASLEARGYEVVAFVVDYLYCIHAADREARMEPRREYGQIIREFKSFATKKDLTLLTASQLNRDATRKVDGARSSGKHSDVILNISRDNIGESMQILDNTDSLIVICPEIDEKIKYMGFNVLKNRSYSSATYSMFFQPFKMDSAKPSRFVEDMGMPGIASKKSLSNGNGLNEVSQTVIEDIAKGRQMCDSSGGIKEPSRGVSIGPDTYQNVSSISEMSGVPMFNIPTNAKDDEAVIRGAIKQKKDREAKRKKSKKEVQYLVKNPLFGITKPDKK